jgi:hypothetical protein
VILRFGLAASVTLSASLMACSSESSGTDASGRSDAAVGPKADAHQGADGPIALPDAELEDAIALSDSGSVDATTLEDAAPRADASPNADATPGADAASIPDAGPSPDAAPDAAAAPDASPPDASACNAVTLALASGSGSASMGSTVPLDLTLSTSGCAVASLQWSFVYPSADLTIAAVVNGPETTAASKTTACALRADDAGVSSATYNCILYGVNTTTIGDGVVVTANFQIATSSPDPSADIQLTAVLSASPMGDGIAVTATGGTIAILP